MGKSFRCLIIFCATLFSASALFGGALSESRISAGRAAALSAWRKHPDMSREDVVALVKKTLSGRYRELQREPRQKALTEIDFFRDYDRKFQQVLDEKFPVYSSEQLESLAARAYPLYKRGDRATVYYARGNHIDSVTGMITAIEEARVIIGSRRIYYSEMRPVQGNDVELLKFLPEENRQAREAYKRKLTASMAEKRSEFRQNHHHDVEQALAAKGHETNEKAGYTYCGKKWLAPQAFFGWIADDVATTLDNERFEAMNRNLGHRRVPIEAQRLTLELRYQHDIPGRVSNPAAKAQQEQEEKRMQNVQALAEKRAIEETKRETEARLAAAKAARERAEKAAAEAKAAAAAKTAAEAKAAEEAAAAKAAEEEAAAEAAEAARKAAKKAKEEAERQQELEAQRQLEAEANSFMAGEIGGIPVQVIMVFGGLVVLCGVVAMVLLVMRKTRHRDEDTFKKFFEGKGKLQKDFWSQADADPEHFKYVAYLFPSLELATDALSHLSYMRMTGSGGDLRCTRQLLYGVYPHQGAAVCFVGGVKFSYALWREASAVLPELPGAQYFKVSTEPNVLLDIPDLDKLKSDKHLHIEDLGQEDQEGEHGEFNRLYKYRAPNRDEAMEFLEKFNINEAGIIVQVETPDGILGKDENGLFTLEDNALDGAGVKRDNDDDADTAEKDAETAEKDAAPAAEEDATSAEVPAMPKMKAPADAPAAAEDAAPAEVPAMPKMPKLKAPSKPTA